MPDDPTPAERLRQEQEKLYGTYVATQPIDIRGARAFNVGDPVPVSHVERGVVPEDAVAKVSTKAGKQAAADSPTTGSEG